MRISEKLYLMVQSLDNLKKSIGIKMIMDYATAWAYRDEVEHLSE